MSARITFPTDDSTTATDRPRIVTVVEFDGVRQEDLTRFYLTRCAPTGEMLFDGLDTARFSLGDMDNCVIVFSNGAVAVGNQEDVKAYNDRYGS
jgi:hypothetical protein